MPTKAELIVQLNEAIAERDAFAAELGIARVEKIRSGRNNFKYLTTRTRHDGGLVSHTPNAVDMIRKYWWKFHESMDRKQMVSHLLSQKFAEGTVRTRISWLENGTDESHHNAKIRARLGLDEMEEVEA